MRSETRPNPPKYRARRRRYAGRVFPHYAIEHALQIGMEKVKDVSDLRKRAGTMQQDDALWLLVEDWVNCRKLESKALNNIEHHMEEHYGKKAKAK